MSIFYVKIHIKFTSGVFWYIKKCNFSDWCNLCRKLDCNPKIGLNPKFCLKNNWKVGGDLPNAKKELLMTRIRKIRWKIKCVVEVTLMCIFNKNKDIKLFLFILLLIVSQNPKKKFLPNLYIFTNKRKNKNILTVIRKKYGNYLRREKNKKWGSWFLKENI